MENLTWIGKFVLLLILILIGSTCLVVIQNLVGLSMDGKLEARIVYGVSQMIFGVIIWKYGEKYLYDNRP